MPGETGGEGSAPRRLLFLFLDGLGLGSDDPATNPLSAASMPTLTGLLGGPLTASTPMVSSERFRFQPLDATLGVEGLPQSATGQTTLLTGVNGAEAMGRHYGPWPGPTLKALLERDTLFHHAERLEGAVMANAYPAEYFDALKGRRLRANAPVVAAGLAAVELRDLERYRAGEAVAADLDGERFAELRPGMPTQPPAAAAAALAALARGASLTFFDLWLTDALGHAQDMTGALALLARVDALLAGLLEEGAGRDFTLLLTSDHGNLEELGTPRHTENAVPLLVLGPGAEEFAGARSIIEVAPAIRRLWGAAEVG